MRFSNKLSVLFISIIVVITAIILAISYFQIKKVLGDHLENDAKDRAFSTMKAIDRFIYYRFCDIKTIAGDSVISSENADPNEIAERLIHYRDNYKCYISLSFYNLERVCIADTAGLQVGEQYPMSPYWVDVQGGMVSVASDVRIAQEIQMPVIYFASVVNNKKGKAIGVVVSRVLLKRLFEIINDSAGIQNEETEETVDLINKDGLLIYSNRNFEGILKVNLSDLEPIKRTHQGEILGSTNFQNLDRNGFFYTFCREPGYLDFKGNGWTIVFYTPARVILALVNRQFNILIMIFLLVLVPVTFIIYFFGNALTRPLRQLSFAADEIGKGKFDTVIKIRSNDEIGMLANALNFMTADLKKNTTSINNLNKEIIERKRIEEALNRKTLELDAKLKEELKSREILVSMLEDNNEIREKIIRSEAMFRNIFDYAGDGILITDLQSKKFKIGNNAICRMLGYSKDEIEKLGIEDIHPEKDLPIIFDQFERQAKGEFSISRDSQVKRKDGSIFHADINATIITIDGKVNLMGLFHDISERKELEDLKKIDQLKKDFIANMSHELRTPLNAVIGFSEILVDQNYGALNETQKDYLNDILESGKFLLSLINDILDLAKIESGKTELVICDFSLKELLEHSLIFVKEKACMHNIELSLEIAEDVGYIRADERKVKQIVFNLISNAVKFTPNDGKAGLKAKINGSFVEVTVWDTGLGISKEDQNKLFRPFMQLESSLTKKHEGTGLGLSLAKELTLLHKGKIWVESEGKGKGSSFKFSLPIGVL